QQAPFDHGHEQMQLLDGVEVTTKSVERAAEAIRGDIAQREQGDIQKARQLDLPVIVDEPLPFLYVLMDGTGLPGVKKEPQGLLGDGAEWICNLVSVHFLGAIQIVDFYHACQHLLEVARRLHPHNEGNQKTWMKIHQKLLEKGKIEKLVLSLRSMDADNPDVAEKIRTEADYFARNAERMRYPQFRCQHLFVGSVVIEAGCKTVIGYRLTR